MRWLQQKSGHGVPMADDTCQAGFAQFLWRNYTLSKTFFPRKTSPGLRKLLFLTWPPPMVTFIIVVVLVNPHPGYFSHWFLKREWKRNTDGRHIDWLPLKHAPIEPREMPLTWNQTQDPSECEVLTIQQHHPGTLGSLLFYCNDFHDDLP